MVREVRERDQGELAVLASMEERVRGGVAATPRAHSTNGAATSRWSLEDERRARLDEAVANMRAFRERRHAETTAVIEAIAGALGLDAARLGGMPFVRAEVSTLVHTLRQIA